MSLGAATEPLDGRALTHGVDARAGEGAGSSAGFLPPPDHHGCHLSLWLAVSRFLMEKWGKEKERRASAAVYGRAAPLTAACRAAGRGEDSRRRRWLASCGWEEKRMKELGFSGLQPALYTPPKSVGWF
jgi:hypothetical protein